MRKQCIAAMLLALSLLLSACGGPSEPVQEESSPAVSEAVSPPPSSSVEPSDGQETPSEEAPEAENLSEDKAEDEAHSSDEAELLSADEAEDEALSGIWTLLERDGICLRLIFSRDLASFAPCAYLRLSYPDLEESRLLVDNMLINDSIQLNDTQYSFGDAENILALPLGNLFALGAVQQGEELRFRCQIHQFSWNADGEMDILWEETCEARIPAGFQPDFVFLPCMGAKAQEQLLLDDGRLRITLLGMGVPAAEKDRLRCILRVENLSEESLPFQINGMNVNRTSFKCYGSRYQLAPGGACYASTYLNRSELERSGIDSISDVELWLMTDQRENNGLMLDPDGTWFPVELNERGETVSDPEYETLLYEDELVRIALVGTEQYDWTETSSYTWHLLVWNLSDQDLTLTSEANSAGLDVRFYTVVGVQSCVYDDASYEIPQGEPLPSIPFSFAIYSTGRASLLKTVPDAFQLPGF